MGWPTLWTLSALLCLGPSQALGQEGGACPDVKIVGLGAQDKVAVIQGCPGFPGPPGPKGDRGSPAEKGQKGDTGAAPSLGEYILKSLKISSIVIEISKVKLPMPSTAPSGCHGAWWYKDCHHSNLNGRYLSGSHESYADGINWMTGQGYRYSYKVAEMKIRAS